MPSFEDVIHKIGNEISVQKENRESFTKDYDAIRFYLMEIMERTDPVFEKIHAGDSLFGSYPDNMKIDEPDEFDVHFLLQLPFYEHIEPQRDSFQPGFVKLLISKPLLLMRQDSNLNFVYEKFNKFVTPSKYIMREKIKNWLHNIIKSALNVHGNSVFNAARTEKYILKYIEKGTAHTIKAHSKSREISIDFVPAFRFNANNDWFAEKPFPKDVTEKFWFAVPKPTVDHGNTEGLTFSICVPQTEKHLLKEKHNLKPSIRLFKSIRDKVEEGYLLKSYFIKSVYMIENDKQDDNFWMQPPGKLLLHMIDRLLMYLDKKWLPFYWCPSMNLMESLRADQALHLKIQFKNIRDRLDFFSNQPDVDYTKLRQIFGESNTTFKIED